MKVQSAPLIIGHTAVDDFDQIPDYWLDQIKNNHMVLQSICQSHSRQITYGLVLLQNLDSKYAVQIESVNSPPTPDPANFSQNALWVLAAHYSPYNRWEWGANHYNYWSTSEGVANTVRTAQRMQTLEMPLTASMWIWSFHIGQPSYYTGLDGSGSGVIFGDTDMNVYLNAIAGFNEDPQVNQTKFLYVTSITDVSNYGNDDNQYRVTHYNEVIRQAAVAEDGILFDQGDIELYDNATNSVPNYQTDSLGRTVTVRHPDYSESVEPNTMGVASNPNPLYQPGDHTNDALNIRKAKAAWVLMARLAGWTGTDTTPPVITEVSASSITATQATITWTTDEPATSQVEYGLDTSYGTSTPLQTTFQTAHEVLLTNLAPQKTYHYRVISRDIDGNLELSGDYTLTTPDAPVVTRVRTWDDLHIDVTFSKPMGTGATTSANYTLSDTGRGTLAAQPNSVIALAPDRYRLTWTSGQIGNGLPLTVTVAPAVADVDGNPMGTPAGGNDIVPLWVDADYVGTELGTQFQPFNTMTEGIAAVASGGTLKVYSHIFGGPWSLTKPLRIEAWDGSVRFGVAGGSAPLTLAPEDDGDDRVVTKEGEARTPVAQWVLYR